MSQFVKVAQVSEIPSGSARVIEAEGKSIALCNADGSFHAVDNTCLHRGGPIGEGTLEGTTVTCPWHGWQYDITTGQSTMNPTMKLASYETKVEGDDVLVAV